MIGRVENRGCNWGRISINPTEQFSSLHFLLKMSRR